jgi:hypothetical protein
LLALLEQGFEFFVEQSVNVARRKGRSAECHKIPPRKLTKLTNPLDRLHKSFYTPVK